MKDDEVKDALGLGEEEDDNRRENEDRQTGKLMAGKISKRGKGKKRKW